MKKTLIGIARALAFVFICGGSGCTARQEVASTDSLKEAFSGIFYIGTAMNTPQITGENTEARAVIAKHFSSIVAENCMKSGLIQPEEGKFDFTLADQFIEYGEANGMHIIGHTLIWHSQAPRWFFVDDQGNDVSPDVLAERMKTHIYTVVGRYKGRVHGWDVVNEAIEDDGSWRNSKFYQILGKDFVRLAFEYAREADPGAELYYNDYSMANPGRRQGVIDMVKDLQEQGVKVDGIGMQAHVSLDYPTIDDYETSILAFSALGAKVMITEMDISVLPFPTRDAGANVGMNIAYDTVLNPYAESLPDSISNALTDRYVDFFELFLAHQDKISRVTFWGVNDGQSWKNNWPVRGRTDYPLIFDRNYQPKPVVAELIKMAEEYKAK